MCFFTFPKNSLTFSIAAFPDGSPLWSLPAGCRWGMWRPWFPPRSNIPDLPLSREGQRQGPQSGACWHTARDAFRCLQIESYLKLTCKYGKTLTSNWYQLPTFFSVSLGHLTLKKKKKGRYTYTYYIKLSHLAKPMLHCLRKCHSSEKMLLKKLGTEML